MRVRPFLNSVTHCDLPNLLQFAFRFQPILTLMSRVAASLLVELISAVLDLLRVRIGSVVGVLLMFIFVVLHSVIVVSNFSVR